MDDSWQRRCEELSPLLPHKVKGEGHFAALFRKADGVEYVDKQCIKEDDISKSVHKETKDKEKMCKDEKTQNTSKVKMLRFPKRWTNLCGRFQNGSSGRIELFL